MAKYKVCTRCQGEGKHVNPAIDGNGLSQEDFDELGPDFEEDYFAGTFDVTCELCKGQRVIEDTPEAEAERQDDRAWAAEIEREYLMMGGR